jgi:hypothetical protein
LKRARLIALWVELFALQYVILAITEATAMRCVTCHQEISRKTAWKVSASRFYCSEFCADSETVVPSQRRVPKDRIDQQYMERLQRLLPLRRAIQKTAA